MSMTVDEFVKTRVLPEQQDIVALLRKMMREYAPNAKELIAYGIPMYKGKRTFAYINPTKNHITFGFSRGTEFEDKYYLLEGVGKRARNVRIKNLRDVNKEALRYYIKQALEHDG